MRPAPILLSLLLMGACDATPVQNPQGDDFRKSPVPGPAWAMHSITLYLPGEVIEPRVPANTLAGYIEALKGRAATGFSAHSHAGVSGVIIVMIKPGQEARSWIVTGTPIQTEIRESLEQSLEAVKAPDVPGGPVVFGLVFSAWGGGTLPPGMPMPVPESWQVLSGPEGGLMDDAFFNEAWALPG